MEPNPSEQRPPWESSHLAVVKPDSSAVMSADEWNQRRVDFVIANFCGGAPAPEASAFIEICKRRGLSPEEKQIYLIPRQTGYGQNKKTQWTPQTGIDGYRLIAERTGNYAGSDEPVYVDSGRRTPDQTYTNDNGSSYTKQGITHPDKATVTVWKFVNGQRCPFTASALWDEYNTGKNLWVKMPYTMLGKCAESLALRKAFPNDLSGIYTKEEMEQADIGDPTPAVARTSANTDEPLPGGNGVTRRQIARIHALKTDKGLSDDAIRTMHGLASGKLLDAAQADVLIQRLVDLTPTMVDDLNAEAAEPETAAGTAEPIDVEHRVIDPDTGEIDPQPITEDEAMLIEFGERAEAAFTLASMGNSADLERLYGEAGSDPTFWIVLLRRAPTLPLLRRVRTEHVKSGCASDPACVAVYNERQGAFGRVAT